MDTFDSIVQRRAIKQFDPSHRLGEDELRQLLRAAALAPTSFNMQNRHFVVVTDPEVRERVKAAAWGQAHVADCSALFVLTGDFTTHTKSDRYLRNAPEEARATLSKMITDFYADNLAIHRDESCRSVGFAGMNLMLAAKAMGYDSCPMIGFDPAAVSEILGLDSDHPPLLLVPVGRALAPARQRLGLLDLEELVSIDRFGNHELKGEIEG